MAKSVLISKIVIFSISVVIFFVACYTGIIKPQDTEEQKSSIKAIYKILFKKHPLSPETPWIMEGFLIEKQMVTAGSTMDYYLIWNKKHESIGYITSLGCFFKYDATGERVKIGVYNLKYGLKLFFNYPQDAMIELEKVTSLYEWD